MLYLQLSVSLLLIAACCMPTYSQRIITCENGGVQRLACGAREVISVQRALYGRTDRRTCSAGRPPRELTNTHCIQDGTLAVLSDRCDGRQVCEVAMQVFQSSDPCYGTFKYLDTSYACIPAITVVPCEGQNAVLDCGKNRIKMMAANYGRRDRQTCSAGKPAGQVAKTDCILSSSLSEMATRCDGKRLCTVPATNNVFGDPCVGTYKYLEVSFTCTRRLG